ncbi:MAG: O-acetylhomoserine aminocarboxypropyltransferase/cysteine synthase [Succinivibrionaceae bacterium]|nr:O-acetylhomoserine aminocarboxypropyltransferase/cysteine synthase [Succinivibrionaceae bacterium]
MLFNTALLHDGADLKETHGATLPPVYQVSAFHHDTAERMADIFSHRAPGYNYTRVANPTIAAFENRITKLEKGIASVASSSGMTAISTATLNLAGAGDEIVSSNGLYGGTYYLFRDLRSLGITTRFVDIASRQEIEAAITEKTKFIFAETIGNPSLVVTDIAMLSDIAKSHGIPLVIDNTVATAYLARPLEQGADIVINSSSKYINGSGTAISGILTDGGSFDWKSPKFPEFADYRKFGKFAFIAKLRNGFARDLGGCLAPMNAFLNLVGLETLGLRMEKACGTALELARWFSDRCPGISVNYPGLETSPSHQTAQRILKNGFGAILTIRTGSRERAFEIMNRLKLVYRISNIGDSRTLIIHPDSTLALHNSPEERVQSGVYDDLLRISVGLEDAPDLIEDFRQAIGGDR